MSDAIASASELVVRYGHQTILDGATIAIQEGDRVGLLGRNGAGKSTFLRIAAGDFAPDSGSYATRRDLVTGYLPQRFELDEAATVLDNILEGARSVLNLIDEYETTPPEGNRSAELLDLITHADGWALDQRAGSLINHLHAPEPDRIVGTLSGGERRRVALCRALLAKPDFLILDEPTNHLDTEAIEWLEDFLSRYTGTCLFVTHDRYFLDRVSTRIIELARGTFTSYQGNYTDYLLTRAERQASEESQEHKRQRFLKRELDWVRRAPKARGTKAKDRMDRYFETAAQEAPEEELDVELIIPPAPKLGNRVIELRGIGVELGGRTLINNLDLELAPGERLGIVGRNGQGKSTLLKVILGKLEPTRGTVEIGQRTEINDIDQDRLALDDTKSVFEEVGEGREDVKLGDETIGLRSYLRRFLFTEERINTRIELLSGGERSRVLLAKILKRGGNVLILDEPTNDLDLGTLRLLEEAVAGFKGSVIVVSHDRYFLNRVCTHILAFEGDGEVRYHVGNYDTYLERRAAENKMAASQSGAGAAKGGKRGERAKKLTWNEERELGGIEAVILAAEEEVERLNAIFGAPDFHATHVDTWQQIENDLAAAKTKAASLYSRWEALEAIRLAAAG
jgi:ATP-binding cassette subfamily F protein uup